MHESRHKHAMRRPRGPGGRFLSASEMAALEAQEKSKTQTPLNESSLDELEELKEFKGSLPIEDLSNELNLEISKQDFPISSESVELNN